MTTKTPIGRLQPGDEVFEQRGRRIKRLGVVESVKKNIKHRSVSVRFTNGESFSQNWAAHFMVRRPPAARGVEIGQVYASPYGDVEVVGTDGSIVEVVGIAGHNTGRRDRFHISSFRLSENSATTREP